MVLPQNRLPQPFARIDVCHGIYKCIQPGNNFFYKVFSGEHVIETGIAEVRKEGSNYYIDREFAFSVLEDGRLLRPRDNKPRDLVEDTVYTVRSYVPENYVETLASPNSVLCSLEAFNPTPVELKENSVLGRPEGGLVQSIQMNHLSKMLGNDLLTAVRQTSTPFILMTDQVELMGENSRVACNHLWLKPADKPKRRSAGMLYYNETTKSFEYYDGLKWRKLLSENAE